MREKLANVSALCNKLKEIFQCQICFRVKDELSTVFYWDCEHLFCTDCIDEGSSCKICCLKDVQNSGKQMKIIENENISAIFRFILKFQFSSLVSNDDTYKNGTVEVKQGRNTKKQGKPKVIHQVSKTSKSESQGKNKKIPNVSKRNHKGETPLHLACRKGNIQFMQELIDAGANPNLQDNAGWTPLHDSIAFGRTEVIKFLLKNGARVNTPGHENTSPLHQSVAERNVEITRLLLKYGADKNARDIYGETPLDLAKKLKFTDIEEIMYNTPAKFKPSPPGNDSILLPPSKTDVILFGFNLNESETALFESFCHRFQYKMVDKVYTPHLSATHIVLPEQGTHDITWNIITGVLMTCRLVSFNWVKESDEAQVVQAMDKYEVTDEFYKGFTKSIQNRTNQLPGLFSGCHFYFGGNFELYKTKKSNFLKTELKILVEKSGGVILSRNPDPESLALEKTIPYHARVDSSLANTSYYIIYSEGSWNPTPKYNMTHMKTLPVEWLLASIFNFELLDPRVNQSYMEYI